jgi:hypothetical protein
LKFHLLIVPDQFPYLYFEHFFRYGSYFCSGSEECSLQLGNFLRRGGYFLLQKCCSYHTVHGRIDDSCDLSFMKKIRSRSDAKEEKSRVGRSF